MPVFRFIAADTGCYIDGHWGQYGVARLVEFAIGHGWDDAEAADLAARHLAAMGPSSAPGLDGDEFERLMWAADEAETWLNENHAPEGCAWGWISGEFFLYALDDEGDDEEEESSNPYAGPGDLLDEIRQSERMLGTW